MIAITDFDIIKETNEYLKDYRFRDRQGNELTDSQTIVFLDLSKIESILKKPVDEMTNVEQWAIFFKYVTDRSKKDLLDKIIERGAGIRMATNILLEVSKDEEARAYYESELIFELDQRGKMRQAKEEGKLEMVREMLLDGESIQKIMKYSKFTEREIWDIKKTL